MLGNAMGWSLWEPVVGACVRTQKVSHHSVEAKYLCDLSFESTFFILIVPGTGTGRYFLLQFYQVRGRLPVVQGGVMTA